MEEINAERDQLEQELAEARKMREELDKLKAMLEAKAENNGSGDATNNN
jgi:chaperonin cofactor prefoldin